MADPRALSFGPAADVLPRPEKKNGSMTSQLTDTAPPTRRRSRILALDVVRGFALCDPAGQPAPAVQPQLGRCPRRPAGLLSLLRRLRAEPVLPDLLVPLRHRLRAHVAQRLRTQPRSEERRVGKESRSAMSAQH